MQTVGKILQAEREKRNLSIKDVELATSIRALYIKAIESDDYKIIPGEVYLKGFIRNYADFLGLNTQELMEVYRQSTSNIINPDIPAPQEITTANIPEPVVSAQQKHSNLAGILSAVIIMSIVGVGGWWYISNMKTPTTPPIENSKPAPIEQPQPQTPPVQPPPPSVQTKSVVVNAKFSAECWTAVIVDGKTIYQGIPKIGETITWEAQKSITIRAGNAAGIELSVNGQPQGKLGGKGEVIEKTFSSKT